MWKGIHFGDWGKEIKMNGILPHNEVVKSDGGKK